MPRGSPPGPANRVARELVAQFPDAPALTLAKILYRDHPQLYSSVEHARDYVRRVLGVHGDHDRKNFAEKNYMRAPRKAGWSDIIPEALIQLPDWKAEVIEGPHRALVLSDVHIPFHDPAALEIALEYGEQKKPTMLLLNGDICDHYAQSDYVKDPRHRDTPGEVLKVKQFLGGLRKRFGKKVRIIYKHGNHEERWNRYLRHKAPELLGVAEFEWENVFGLHQHDVQLIEHKRPIRLGKLNVIHGHEYNFAISNPVNPARGLFLRGKTHAICGHFHQSSNHSEKNLEGLVVSTWSTGALCDLHPEYRPLNNWNFGFAWVEIGRDGSFHVQNNKIIGGRVW